MSTGVAQRTVGADGTSDRVVIELTGNEIGNRLRYLGLGERDWQRLRAMHGVVAPFLHDIIESFYDIILAEPELATLVEDDELRAHLKKTQREYIQTLLTSERNGAYFRQRLRIGEAHLRVGLDQRWYVTSFYHLERLIAETFRRNTTLGGDELHAHLDSLHRAIMLDISLALDAYVQTLTERLNAEARQAREASRMKSEFLSKMSHELRTPLNAIINFTEYVKMQSTEQLSDKLQDRLERVLTNADYLLALINDILDMSKIEAGKLEVHPEPVGHDALLESVLPLTEPMFKSGDTAFRWEVRGEPFTLTTDPMRLRQILLNLLSNAAKFTREGNVWLRIRHDKGRVHFEVEDTGIGIPAEEQSLIFSEFQQLEKPASTSPGGTGLGLAISQRLCGMLGGHIEVASEEGVGSRFFFSLPVEGPATTGHITAPTPSSPIHSLWDRDRIPEPLPVGWRRVLVIDDDPDVIIHLNDILAEEHFQVIGTLSASEGLALARELRPAVILLDILLPQMDGLSLIQTIKEDPQLQHIPVIFNTVLDHRALGLSLGASDYLVKPIRVDELKQALERVVTGQNGSVLLTPPASAVLEQLEHMVHEVGCAPVSVTTGAEALTYLESGRPVRAVVLDFDARPPTEGLQFLQELARSPAQTGVPIIALSRAPEALPVADTTGSTILINRENISNEEMLARLKGVLTSLALPVEQ